MNNFSCILHILRKITILFRISNQFFFQFKPEGVNKMFYGSFWSNTKNRLKILSKNSIMLQSLQLTSKVCKQIENKKQVFLHQPIKPCLPLLAWRQKNTYVLFLFTWIMSYYEIVTPIQYHLKHTNICSVSFTRFQSLYVVLLPYPLIWTRLCKIHTCGKWRLTHLP